MKKLVFAFLVLSFALSSQAAVLKIATVTPEGSQWMTDMRNSAKEIKERTGQFRRRPAGRVLVQVANLALLPDRPHEHFDQPFQVSDFLVQHRSSCLVTRGK